MRPYTICVVLALMEDMCNVNVVAQMLAVFQQRFWMQPISRTRRSMNCLRQPNAWASPRMATVDELKIAAER